MKILVFDDSELHRRAAVVQLAGHDVIVVDNFDAAVKALTPKGYGKDMRKEEWDIVLTDLLVPASDKHQGPKGQKYVGQEMPLGTAIVLIAFANGVKKVGLLTDTNHHHHPASAAVDDLASPPGEWYGNCKRGVCRVGDAFLYTCQSTDEADANTLELIRINGEVDESKYPYRKCWDGSTDYSSPRENAVDVKPWADAVAYLMDPFEKRPPRPQGEVPVMD